MPEMPITLIRGDKVSPNVDYRTAMPVNVSGVLREMLGAKGYMLQEPGLTAIGIGSGKDRGGIWNERRKQHFRVSGTNLISVAQNGATEVLGTIDGTDPVSMPYSFNSQAIIGGGKMYLFEAGTVTEVTDPNLRRPLDAVWVDGYYFLTDGEYLYHTQLADESAIDPLDFATAEFSPDQTVGLGLTMDNKVIVFGRYTIEYFVNAAESEFAFTRLPTRAVKYGLVGTHAKCEIGGQFYFLGNPKESNVTVYALGVGSVEEIASREVAKLISEYSEEQLETVVMEARVIDDYTYLILHLPEETLLFNQNIAAGVGKDFAWSIIKSSTHLNRPYRGIHGVYDPRRSEWVYGDKWSSTIGFLDEETATHYGEPVECIIYTPFVYLEHQSIDELEIFMIPGFYTPNWPFAARISGESPWPGGPDGFSTVEADPSIAIANGTATVKIITTVRDTNNEPVLGLTEDSFEYIGAESLEKATFTDTGSGVYTQTFTNDIAVVLSIKVNAESVPIGTVQVEFYQVGELFGWGSNAEPVFEEAGDFPVPKPMGTGSLWIELAGATSQASTDGNGNSGSLLPRSSLLAVNEDSGLYGVGYNWRGVLGVGEQNSESALVQTGGDTNDWDDVVAGGWVDPSSDHFSIALKSDGTIHSTGFNENGELGHGNTTSPVLSYTQIGTDTDWTAIFAGSRDAAALKGETAYVWGQNGSGELGLGDIVQRTSPTLLGSGITYIAYGAVRNRMAAIIQGGEVYTCGSGVGGQLGLGSTDDFTTFQSTGLTDAQMLDISIRFEVTGSDPCHTVVLKTDGTIWGWGGNGEGQLGQGDTVNRDTPVQIGDADDWVKVAATGLAIFAINGAGEMYWAGRLPGGSVETVNTLQRFPFAGWFDIDSGGTGMFALRVEQDIADSGNFDLAAASSAGTLSSLFSGTDPIDFKWLDDGNQFAFTDTDGVYVAGVNTAYDITTYDGAGVQNQYLGGNSPKVSFSPDGTIMLYGRSDNVIETHFLTTPNDVSTQILRSSATYTEGDGYHAIDPSGTWFLVKEQTSAISSTWAYRLYQLTIPWDVENNVVNPPGEYSEEVLEDSPLAYLRFGEDSGSAALDSSGNDNDAAYQGTFTLGEPGLVVDDENTCVDLEGTGYVDSLVDTGGVSTVTFEIILGAIEGSGEQRVYDWQDSSGYFTLKANVPSSGRLEAAAQVGGSNITADAEVDFSVPHHVVVVQDESGDIELFVDGVEVASDTLGGTFSGTGTDRAIGRTRNANSNFVDGKVDEFAVYTSLLSTARVLEHAAAAGYNTSDNPKRYDVSALPGGSGDNIGSIAWSGDGTKLYWLSNDTNAVRSATMTDPFGIVSATDDGDTLSMTDGTAQGVTLKNNSETLYLCGGGEVEQFNDS